jgi:hypothetical protein
MTKKESIFNMDEAATDMTKHQCKVIMDNLSIVCQFALTLEGDGKMNMHITVCLTTWADAIFKHSTREIEGAYGPLLNQTDKSKTKQKEIDELISAGLVWMP